MEDFLEITIMHELSVTESILNIVLKHAQTNGAEKILAINLRIGELTDLVGDCIQQYFDYMSKGTIAEGAKIEVEKTPIVFQCRDCQNTFEVSFRDTKDFTCTNCGGSSVSLLSGREFYIKDITIS
jgi:hydrogenase nickel incorporation protein HypA/HybF